MSLILNKGVKKASRAVRVIFENRSHYRIGKELGAETSSKASTVAAVTRHGW